MSSARYVEPAETARYVRVHLKKAFGKGVKFSVRTSTYSMGATVSVSWTDGPTEDQVTEIVGMFDGNRFEGMSDCTYYADQWYCAEHGAVTAELYGGDAFCPSGPGASRCCAKAELVHFATSISTSRDLSPETTATLAAAVAHEYGVDFDTYEPQRFLPEADEFFGTLVYRASRAFAC